VCALAIRTGIAPHEWERSGGRYIATAFELLNDQDRRHADSGGPVMSG
jgi:hypothetical protein